LVRRSTVNKTVQNGRNKENKGGSATRKKSHGTPLICVFFSKPGRVGEGRKKAKSNGSKNHIERHGKAYLPPGDRKKERGGRKNLVSGYGNPIFLNRGWRGDGGSPERRGPSGWGLKKRKNQTETVNPPKKDQTPMGTRGKQYNFDDLAKTQV